jgi:hypothetical protein
MKRIVELSVFLVILLCYFSEETTTQIFYMRIIQPNGGDILNPGKIYEIKWETKANGGFVSSNGGVINLYYFSIEPQIPSTSIAECVPNTGSYKWVVPTVESNAVVVYAEWLSQCHGFGLYNDSSDFSLTITKKTKTPSYPIDVTSGNAKAGTIHADSCSTSDDFSSNLNLATNISSSNISANSSSRDFTAKDRV